MDDPSLGHAEVMTVLWPAAFSMSLVIPPMFAESDRTATSCICLMCRSRCLGQL